MFKWFALAIFLLLFFASGAVSLFLLLRVTGVVHLAPVADHAESSTSIKTIPLNKPVPSTTAAQPAEPTPPQPAFAERPTVDIEYRILATDPRPFLPGIESKDGIVFGANELKSLLKRIDRRKDGGITPAPKLSVNEAQEASVAIGETKMYVSGYEKKGIKYEPVQKNTPPRYGLKAFATYDPRAKSIALKIKLESNELLRLEHFVFAIPDGKDIRKPLPYDRPKCSTKSWEGKFALKPNEAFVAYWPGASDNGKPACIILVATLGKGRNDAGGEQREKKVDPEF